MKLEFAPQARRDLIEIAGYIARDNPVRATNFVDELEEVCRKLTAFPQAAPLRPDFGPGIRGLTWGLYHPLQRPGRCHTCRTRAAREP